VRKGYLVLLLLLFSTLTLNAQVQNISKDSLSTILCKKWAVKAAFVSEIPVNSSAGAVTYEFSGDHSFVMVTDKKAVKGIWKYERKNKVIQLLINKKINLYIVSLNQNEFALSPALLEDFKSNPLGAKILFKPAD
jgi:hypothetical protein